MTTRSVFGASPPPGTYATYSDGSPSIRLAQKFYRYGGLIPDTFKIIGGRVWLPAAPVGSTQINIMLWTAGSTIETAPVQQVIVDIVGTGWQEGLFATPQDLPVDGVNFRIGYQFVGNDDNYVFTTGLRADAENIAIGVDGLALSELKSVFSSPVGSAETVANTHSTGYGIDVLIGDDAEEPEPNVAPSANAGVDQNTVVGQQVTLTGTGTDSDGTIISRAWVQVSGPAVVLGGSGATRTFTPATAGLRVFRLTVTDDQGATGVDTVSVTTVAIEVPPEPEQPASAADRLNAALVLLTGCIGSSFDDICTYGLISGDTYVPFDPDEDEAEGDNCDDYGCGQVWVRIEQIAAITPDSWDNNCSVTFRIEIEVGVIRCFEIPEGGEAPTASAMLGYAMQSNEDMNRIFCAAMSCDEVEDEFDRITAGTWLPLGPMGGQYGGTWSFTLETA